VCPGGGDPLIMAKDSYWFRHDSTAGRGLKIQRIQHIYGHEGKGMYWDVVEVLREQENYMYPYSESEMQILGSIIGVKDANKFDNFIKDCIRFDLFSIEGKFLYNKPLSEGMKIWDTKRENGLKAKSKLNGSESEANPKLSTLNRTEQNRTKKGRVTTPPTIDEVVNFFVEKGYTESSGRRAHGFYEALDWHDSNGKRVLNWKSKMISVWHKPENLAPVPKPEVEKIEANKIFNEVD
jgi:hypothetical protein